jgi:WD domain, G-beta repeat
MKKIIIFTSLLTHISFTTLTMENHHGYRKIDVAFDELWDTEDIPLAELKPIIQPPQLSPYSAKATKDTQSKNDISDDNLHELSALLNTEINKQCSRKSLFGAEYQLESSQLEEKDFFDIINIIDEYSHTYGFIKTKFDKTISFMNRQPWCNKKNCDYIPKTVGYFINLTKTNINSVTSKTLHTVNDPNALQSTSQLNKLPSYIKKAFIEDVYQHNIKPSYKIILTGHTDTICAIDIHAHTHRAATSSYDDTLQLWDLKTGKLICIFPKDNTFSGKNNMVHCIAFNSNGSCLATLTNLVDKSTLIRIWDIQSSQLCNIKMKISNINTLYYEDQILMACSNDEPSKAHILLIQDNFVTRIPQPIHLSQHMKTNCLTWNNYKAENPHFKKQSTITITKENCRDFYLYQQAIKNDASSFNYEKINATQFTEYEKDMLQKQLIDQRKASNS